MCVVANVQFLWLNDVISVIPFYKINNAEKQMYIFYLEKRSDLKWWELKKAETYLLEEKEKKEKETKIKYGRKKKLRSSMEGKRN